MVDLAEYRTEGDRVREQLMFIRHGMEVKRFHTVLTLHENTIGNHSCGVAWMVWLLTEGKCTANLLMAALAHDLSEHKVGDIPSPAKRRMGIRNMMSEYEEELLKDAGVSFELTPEEERIIKIADSLDGAMFCVRERAMGNFEIVHAYRNFCSYVEHLNPVDRERVVVDEVKKIWRETANE